MKEPESLCETRSHPLKEWVHQQKESNRDWFSLAIDFFVVFSRFEYALKASGFISGNETVSPDWKKFSQKHQEKFETMLSKNESLQAAVDYLIEHPPNKQVSRKNKLGWREPSLEETDPILKKTVELVRIVRNNLFHGGKVIQIQRKRDCLLLTMSLQLLASWLDLNEEIKRNFYKGLPNL